MVLVLVFGEYDIQTMKWSGPEAVDTTRLTDILYHLAHGILGNSKI